MKLTRPFLVIAAIIASVSSAGSVFAGTGCTDDPERCVERGATVSHRTVAVAPATVAPAPPAPAKITPAMVTPKLVAARKGQSKQARVAPATPAPATPGMGMLLKLSSGGGGDVSLFPSKPAENTGASWVL